ncbi:Xaa-Pro dipeptidase [Thorsellia anophelis]|nr:Xaa-Pro dipeptidase [Thorsellia anophelis]
MTSNFESTDQTDFYQFEAHIKILQENVAVLLSKSKFDALLIHSGELIYSFMDDQSYPFRVNPLFNHWVPITDVPNCWLLVDGVNKPKLWFYSPVDYWHNVETIPNAKWTEQFEISTLLKADDIGLIIPSLPNNIAYLGSSVKRAADLGLGNEAINPNTIINYLHYHRSVKTDYELFCMKQAQQIAVEGHLAAQYAFMRGLSEYEINAAYLLATGQRDTDVPYGNIVAINEHASVLHYTKLAKSSPVDKRSFLLDAGAQYLGYAADLTRTISFDEDDEFAELIKLVTQHQLELISHIKAGVNYTDIHIEMDKRIAEILLEFKLLHSISPEAIVQSGISRTFMPHGVGHPLGLQVHDVAGFMQDEHGTHQSPPEIYPYLRCTRTLESNMVITIEPGVYFIDSLLEKWKNSEYTKHFDWTRLSHFKQYGGVRIEDNIIIQVGGTINMTRQLELP